MENAEINNIIKIVGLQYKKNYEDEDSLKTLRYGKIMIMTDQVRFVIKYFRLLNTIKHILLLHCFPAIIISYLSSFIHYLINF